MEDEDDVSDASVDVDDATVEQLELTELVLDEDDDSVDDVLSDVQDELLELAEDEVEDELDDDEDTSSSCRPRI